MKIYEARWKFAVEYGGKRHEFITEKEECLSDAMWIVGKILETKQVNVPRKEYLIRVTVA